MKNKYILGVLFTLSLSLIGYGQKNLFMSSPRGFVEKNSLKGLETEVIEAPSKEEINKYMIDSGKDGHMYQVAKLMPFTANMNENGLWTEFEDGSKLWQMQVESKGANALAFYFNHYEIPQGAVVFVYNPETGAVSNPEFMNENQDTKSYSTSFVTGSKVVLEYYQPANVVGSPKLEIESVGYYFREPEMVEKRINEFGAAETCHPNAICSEGNSMADQRRSVVKIIVRDGSMVGFCSGALINNTAEDCKNYILSAQHCGAGATVSNMGQWKFYFNWQSNVCSNPTYSAATAWDDQVLTGCSKVAASGTSSSVTGSDFLLIQLSTATIPSSYNVYYAGWDRTNTAPSSGKGFHHPMGDIKKVSTFNSAASSTGWNGAGTTHWTLQWSATTNGHGVTEGGSSGSPLFNSAGRIVGDLSGGSSYCSTPNGPDSYGKFWYSWSSNGGANNQQLKPWLDPNNSNPNTLNGKNACGGTNPNPTSGCDTSGNFIIGTHTATVYNVPGGTGTISGNNSYGDLAKAEKFSNNPSGKQLKGVYYGFGAKSGSGNAILNIWSANGAGTPGTSLANLTVPLTNIPTDGSLIGIDVSANPININGDFFAGVILPTNGATVSLFTSASGEVAGTTGYEQVANGTWVSYSASYGQNLANAVFKILCDPTTSLSESDVIEGLKLYPNPSSGLVYLISENGQVISDVKVIDMTGKLVYSVTKPAYESATTLDLGSLSNGIYQVSITVNGMSVAKKLILSK